MENKSIFSLESGSLASNFTFFLASASADATLTDIKVPRTCSSHHLLLHQSALERIVVDERREMLYALPFHNQ